MNEQDLEKFAVDIIQRLVSVVKEQQQTITKYEGAIEGIKLFMSELKKKIEEQKQLPPEESNGNT
jgi:phage shock protein A